MAISQAPDIGFNMAALFLGAAAVTVGGVTLRQLWLAGRTNAPSSYGQAGSTNTSVVPNPQLAAPLRLTALVAELKSNLAQCQTPTADPLLMDEFQSFCDALVGLSYEALEKTWAAYADIMKVNHFAERAASFAGAMNDPSARMKCIQAKAGCRDRIMAAIDALENNPLADPAQWLEEAEPDLPMPARTVGAILNATVPLSNPT